LLQEEQKSVILAPVRELNRKFTMTPTALIFNEPPTVQEWQDILVFASKASSCSQWAVGDALVYGYKRFERGQYEEAMAVTGLEKQTLRVLKNTSASVEPLIRINDLSFLHHRLVAPMGAVDQKYWLGRAAEGDYDEKAGCNKMWTVARLRREIRLAKEKEEAVDVLYEPQISQMSYEVWLPQQPACDILLTDPPYSTEIKDIDAFANTWLPVAAERVKTTGRIYVFTGAYSKELRAYIEAFEKHVLPLGFSVPQVLVWTCENTLGPSPKMNYKLNWQAVFYSHGPDAEPLNCERLLEQLSVQKINAPDGRQGDRFHAWQKPIDLACRFVKHSAKEGDVLLDPFAGTGTHLLAGARGGLRAFGCDESRAMIDISVQRGCSEIG